MSPRFTSPDGNLVIETAVPSEAASLRNQGFKEEKAKTKAVREQEKAQEEQNAPTPDASAGTPSTTTAKAAAKK